MTKHSIDGQRLFARPRDLRPVGRDGEGLALVHLTEDPAEGRAA